MKYVLMLVLCHGIDCTPAFQFEEKFDSYFDCATAGYRISTLKMMELGPIIVNENKSTVIFACQESQEI